MRNFARREAHTALSAKSLWEYDCKDRRVRVLEETYYVGPWAQGDRALSQSKEVQFGVWSPIGKGSPTETIFNRVCPSDDSDAEAQ